MTDHRPPTVSLVDYGGRKEIESRGESGSNGLITPRAGFDSPAPPSPAAWKDDVARRVADYKQRREDRETRARLALGLELGARQRVGYAGCARGASGGRPTPASTEPLAATRRRRQRFIRAALVACSPACLLLTAKWAAILMFASVCAALVVVNLRQFEALGPEPTGRVTSKGKKS